MSKSAIGIWNKVEEIEQRLMKIEQALRASGTLVGVEPPRQAPILTGSETTTEEDLTPDVEATQVLGTVQVRQPSYESFTMQHIKRDPAYKPGTVDQPDSGGAGKALGLVAAACFLLAAAYFIKLAVETGWLTPLRQYVLTMLFGGSLVLIGWRLKKEDPEYSSVLPATGVVVLYLAVFAGQLIWRLYGFYEAFILSAVVSAVCIFLLQIFKHSIFGVVASVGAYLVPLLLLQKGIGPTEVIFYFLFWDLTFCLLAIFLRQRFLIGTSAYLAILAFAATFEHASMSQYSGFAACAQAVQFIIFSWASLIFSLRTGKALETTEAVAMFPLLLIFHGLEFSYLREISHGLAAWGTLAFAVFLFGLSNIAKNKLQKGSIASEAVTLSFLSIVVFHSLYLEILNPTLQLILGLLLLLALGLAPKRKLHAELGQISVIPFITCVLIISIEGMSAFLDAAFKSAKFQHFLPALLFCMAIFFLYNMQKAKKETDIGMRYLLSGAGTLFGLAALRQIADMGARHDTLYAISILWGIFALALMGWARVTKDKVQAHTSLALFAVVSFKIFFLDLLDSSTAVRIVFLLIMGGILYLAGLLYRQIKTWA